MFRIANNKIISEIRLLTFGQHACQIRWYNRVPGIVRVVLLGNGSKTSISRWVEAVSLC
jgi:hypothetical protein